MSEIYITKDSSNIRSNYYNMTLENTDSELFEKKKKPKFFEFLKFLFPCFYKKKNRNSENSAKSTGLSNIDNIDNLTSKPKSNFTIENYKTNEIIELDSQNGKYSILIKISDVFLKEEKALIKNENNNRLIKRCDNEQLLNLVNDQELLNIDNFARKEASKHIAKRIECHCLADFTLGIGEMTHYFLKKSDFIFSFHNNFDIIEKMKFVFNNNFAKKIDFLLTNQCSFREIISNKKKPLFFDSCVINPYNLFQDFNSNNMNSIEFINFLSNISKKSQSIIFILRKETENFQNLANLICFSDKSNLHCGVEIEKIYIKNKLKLIVIYKGFISKITKEEENKYLFEKIFKNEDFSLKENSEKKNIINFLLSKLGNLKLLNYIKRCDKTEKQITTSIKLYDKLIEFLIKKNIITFTNNLDNSNKISDSNSHKNIINNSIENKIEIMENSSNFSKSQSESNYVITEKKSCNENEDIYEFSDYSDVTESQDKENCFITCDNQIICINSSIKRNKALSSICNMNFNNTKKPCSDIFKKN